MPRVFDPINVCLAMDILSSSPDYGTTTLILSSTLSPSSFTENDFKADPLVQNLQKDGFSPEFDPSTQSIKIKVQKNQKVPNSYNLIDTIKKLRIAAKGRSLKFLPTFLDGYTSTLTSPILSKIQADQKTKGREDYAGLIKNDGSFDADKLKGAISDPNPVITPMKPATPPQPMPKKTNKQTKARTKPTPTSTPIPAKANTIAYDVIDTSANDHNCLLHAVGMGLLVNSQVGSHANLLKGKEQTDFKLLFDHLDGGIKTWDELAKLPNDKCQKILGTALRQVLSIKLKEEPTKESKEESWKTKLINGTPGADNGLAHDLARDLQAGKDITGKFSGMDFAKNFAALNAQIKQFIEQLGVSKDEGHRNYAKKIKGNPVEEAKFWLQHELQQGAGSGYDLYCSEISKPGTFLGQDFYLILQDTFKFNLAVAGTENKPFTVEQIDPTRPLIKLHFDKNHYSLLLEPKELTEYNSKNTQQLKKDLAHGSGSFSVSVGHSPVENLSNYLKDNGSDIVRKLSTGKIASAEGLGGFKISEPKSDGKNSYSISLEKEIKDEKDNSKTTKLTGSIQRYQKANGNFVVIFTGCDNIKDPYYKFLAIALVYFEEYRQGKAPNEFISFTIAGFEPKEHEQKCIQAFYDAGFNTVKKVAKDQDNKDKIEELPNPNKKPEKSPDASVNADKKDEPKGTVAKVTDGLSALVDNPLGQAVIGAAQGGGLVSAAFFGGSVSLATLLWAPTLVACAYSFRQEIGKGVGSAAKTALSFSPWRIGGWAVGGVVNAVGGLTQMATYAVNSSWGSSLKDAFKKNFPQYVPFAKRRLASYQTWSNALSSKLTDLGSNADWFARGSINMAGQVSTDLLSGMNNVSPESLAKAGLKPDHSTWGLKVKGFFGNMLWTGLATGSAILGNKLEKGISIGPSPAKMRIRQDLPKGKWILRAVNAFKFTFQIYSLCQFGVVAAENPRALLVPLAFLGISKTQTYQKLTGGIVQQFALQPITSTLSAHAPAMALLPAATHLVTTLKMDYETFNFRRGKKIKEQIFDEKSQKNVVTEIQLPEAQRFTKWGAIGEDAIERAGGFAMYGLWTAYLYPYLSSTWQSLFSSSVPPINEEEISKQITALQNGSKTSNTQYEQALKNCDPVKAKSYYEQLLKNKETELAYYKKIQEAYNQVNNTDKSNKLEDLIKNLTQDIAKAKKDTRIDILQLKLDKSKLPAQIALRSHGESRLPKAERQRLHKLRQEQRRLQNLKPPAQVDLRSYSPIPETSSAPVMTPALNATALADRTTSSDASLLTTSGAVTSYTAGSRSKGSELQSHIKGLKKELHRSSEVSKTSTPENSKVLILHPEEAYLGGPKAHSLDRAKAAIPTQNTMLDVLTPVVSMGVAAVTGSPLAGALVTGSTPAFLGNSSMLQCLINVGANYTVGAAAFLAVGPVAGILVTPLLMRALPTFGNFTVEPCPVEGNNSRALTANNSSNARTTTRAANATLLASNSSEDHCLPNNNPVNTSSNATLAAKIILPAAATMISEGGNWQTAIYMLCVSLASAGAYKFAHKLPNINLKDKAKNAKSKLWRSVDNIRLKVWGPTAKEKEEIKETLAQTAKVRQGNNTGLRVLRGHDSKPSKVVLDALDTFQRDCVNRSAPGT